MIYLITVLLSFPIISANFSILGKHFPSLSANLANIIYIDFTSNDKSVLSISSFSTQNQPLFLISLIFLLPLFFILTFS
nr:MAG TPA: hypothetical protein [Caudoviricetes sp.]